jgi:nanoRNase/pAp phosphatase (c-di-AMP/oligoRNAs hydrolase)
MDIIIYHGDCPDGWCAAYLLSKAYPDAKLIPATHGEPINVPLLKGLDVIMVDFSLKRGQMISMNNYAKSLVVLDHHKTAEKELEGLDFCQFDMNRSGAAMAWDWLHRGMPSDEKGVAAAPPPRPWYVDYVQDRDLWTWKLPRSRDVSAFLMSLPMTKEVWDTLDGLGYHTAANEGQAINSYINHYVEKVVDERREGMLVSEFDKWSVGVVNAAYPAISEVCNVLCQKGYDIGLGWFQRGDGLVQFSLRSIGDMDVSKIAKAYGGGGHRNAAGFQLEFNKAMELVNRIIHWDVR